MVTLDKSGAKKAALDELNQGKPKDKQINIQQNKYLNNLIEQDHRNVKRRTRPILGLNWSVCCAEDNTRKNQNIQFYRRPISIS
ncbi:integrase [Xenorhabdus hominickii]|uniref:Integrase n=1 Tax=Xenorhabdus hominickii TaxID=351679 RepID=A0A1V0M4T3_XENHO|nr:hypothetical protein [Xenorhabdus hominickii]PHM51895.1 integrase [Xenorhabdus hominickii]